MTFTMAAAETMLCSTQMSISQITEKLHFSNRAHFYKVFDQYYHMTSKQYQEKLRNKTLDI